MMIPGVVSAMSVTGYSGGGVNITCEYDKGYTENKKYFCKGQWNECKDLIRTDIKDKWVQEERFSLYDNTRSSVFTVTIRDLREEDSGTYYCAVDRTSKKDPHTEVNLEVLTGTAISSSSSSSSSSLSSTTSSSSSSSSASSSSSFITSLFTSVPRPSTSLASLNTSTGSSLIVPLVLVLLVLIVAGLLLLFLCKKRRCQGGDLNSQTGPGKHEVQLLILTLVVIMRRLKTLTNNYPQTPLILLTLFMPLLNYPQTTLILLTLFMPLVTSRIRYCSFKVKHSVTPSPMSGQSV